MKAFLETADQGMHIISIDECFAIEIQPVVGWEYVQLNGCWHPLWFNEENGQAERAVGYCQDKSITFANYTVIKALEPGTILHCDEHRHGWSDMDVDIKAIRKGTQAFIIEHFGEAGWEFSVRIMDQLAGVWENEALHDRVDMLLNEAKREDNS